ncbi:hypothetical protein ACGFJC_53865 [Nonomuraea fuscirosea]|uniref:hypothetical protein n=1 Tax=Nonomuraea fuscirosea TaxID=1291556 RepID=UPI003478471E
MHTVTSSSWRLWWRWTRAATLGEIAGFAVPAVTGVWVAAQGWEMLGGIAPLVRTALIVMAGAVEGSACWG